MILTRVILQDYGVYRGRNEFDFTCTNEKPIILVGGTNGAGKTTLFESITLCLYGISTMEKRSTKKSYQKFLARKIHRYLKSATSADHASITVQFKFFHNGQEIEYLVERSWRNEEGSINEQLNIKKRKSGDEKFGPLDIVEKSYWQSFIEDLIPNGIAKLFFFDGERIVEIAKEGTEDITIKESFKSLLGIEIVEQLYADLQVNLTRNLTGEGKSWQQDFEKYKAEKDGAMDNVARLKERLAQKQTEMDSLCMETDAMDAKISKIGGKFASGRDDAKNKIEAKTIIYDNIQQRIIELCDDVLPFAMIPTALEKLAEQIDADEMNQQQIQGKELLESKFESIMSKIKVSKPWVDAGFDPKNTKKAIKIISKLLDDENQQTATSEKQVFGFSTVQTSIIRDIIQRANTSSLQNLKSETEKIIEIGEEMTQLETTLASAPNDDEIGSLISKMGKKHSQAGALQKEMDYIEEKISNNLALRDHLDVKLREIMSLIYKNEKSQQHVTMTQNIQKVLEEFIEKLKIKKIHILEGYLLDAIQTLLHKKGFIEKVKVNPDTFEVTLFRKNNDFFPKDLLSEGEKQMFAMAVLWALAKTTGRPLPFMIDTPLARLDEAHRANIVEKFLPVASHQVLIFSTDTEIENKDYQKLESHLMRSYAMRYIEDEGATQKHEGYFWNKEGKRIVEI